MTNDDSDKTLEPLAITIEETSRLTSESSTQIYNLIAAGELEAVKAGRKTLVIFASVKKRIANLPKLKLERKLRPAPKVSPQPSNLKTLKTRRANV